MDNNMKIQMTETAKEFIERQAEKFNVSTDQIVKNKLMAELSDERHASMLYLDDQIDIEKAKEFLTERQIDNLTEKCRINKISENHYLTEEEKLRTMKTLKCRTHDNIFYTTRENPDECIQQKM